MMRVAPKGSKGTFCSWEFLCEGENKIGCVLNCQLVIVTCSSNLTTIALEAFPTVY